MALDVYHPDGCIDPEKLAAVVGVTATELASTWICRNSFFPLAGLWPALAGEDEAVCSRAGNLIGR
jgi:hypothetical protein